MNRVASPQVIRALGFAVLTGAAAFVIMIGVAGLAFPHYDHVDQMISELGGVDAPHAWIQNVNFVVFGLCVMGVAIALMLDARTPFVGALLLFVLGFSGTFMEGVVHCDSGCEGATTQGAIHLGFGLAGFISGIAALFVLARRWRRDARWQPHARLTKYCAWAALCGFIVFFLSNAEPAIDGLAQRIFVAPLLVFLAATGYRLARGLAPLPGGTERE